MHTSGIFTRRQMLQHSACGFGGLALAALFAKQSAAATPVAPSGAAAAPSSPLAPKAPHFPAKAKRVIFMFNQGAPSHVDTFDYKPDLAKDDGKKPSESGFYKGGNRTLMKSPFEFKQHGKSGLPISSLFPNVAKHADKLCLLNSMHTDLPNHPQASVQLHTGSFQFVRPSAGAWVLYGLGTENDELPGFITINPLARVGGAQNYGSAFLPAPYQGTPIGGEGKSLAQGAIPNIRSNLSLNLQRKQLDYLQSLNRDRLAADAVNTELEGLIESYELAFRMQGAVPKVVDFKDESQATLDAYGVGGKATDNFARQCLLARRFAEAGVRFIEVSTSGWDQHNNLRAQLTKNCEGIDQPIAALLADLEQRGLLHDTLVVWGGEFGRTPHVSKPDGRDHNATGYTMWMAGGGVKGGIRHGATDPHGISAVEKPVHIHDLNATMLHLLGLDHTKLTYRYSGRDFRLTDVHGNVVKEIIV